MLKTKTRLSCNRVSTDSSIYSGKLNFRRQSVIFTKQKRNLLELRINDKLFEISIKLLENHLFQPLLTLE
ncbi:unnamed protein product [Schistosoma curassoni]|nr:unnamed protein product [Schistosoma curassoni]